MNTHVKWSRGQADVIGEEQQTSNFHELNIFIIIFSKILTDLDECEVSGSCGPNMLCMNTVGSFSCSCRQGYRKEKNHKNCTGNSQTALYTLNCNNVVIEKN